MERLNTPELYDDHGLTDPAVWIKYRNDDIRDELSLRFDFEDSLEEDLRIIRGSIRVTYDDAELIARQWHTDACYEWRKLNGNQSRGKEDTAGTAD